jgi:hypothetical protein
MNRFLAVLAIPFIITACGSDDDSTNSASARILDLGQNYLATLEMSDVKNASSKITITIASSNEAALPNTDVTIIPLMNMVSGMTHDTPMSSRSGQLNEDGQFETTAYFLMPSGPETGDWSFTVGFDGQQDEVSIDVDMLTSDREMLVGSEDKILSMDNETGRPYVLFNEGRHVMDGMDSFTVYIAARETMMRHTSLAHGITLTGEAQMDMPGAMEMTLTTSNMSSREMAMPAMGYDLVINSVVVEMCAADCTTASNWITAIPVEGMTGQYKGANLGLIGDETDEIKVRLSVNDELKAKGDGTEYGTFYFSDDV